MSGEAHIVRDVDMPKKGEIYKRAGTNGLAQAKERGTEVFASHAAHLLVDEVVPGDHRGREVRGQISILRGPQRPYSCELRAFYSLWPEGPT